MDNVIHHDFRKPEQSIMQHIDALPHNYTHMTTHSMRTKRFRYDTTHEFETLLLDCIEAYLEKPSYSIIQDFALRAQDITNS